MLRSIFVFITISLMTFLLQYWFVSRLGYPETFATTCQDYTGEFLYEARCEYTFNILFTTITVAFLALFPFIFSQKLSYFIIGCLWLVLISPFVKSIHAYFLRLHLKPLGKLRQIPIPLNLFQISHR
jgi:hypothetical protein